MINLEALTAEVTRAQTVQSSAVMLLKKLTSELVEIHAELAKSKVDAAPLGALIEGLKGSTDALATAVADSVDKKPMTEVILNADDATKPTVQVIMPEELPANVEVTAEVVVDAVDPASTEPQVVVTVTEAAPAPEMPAADAPAMTETVIETAPTQVDVAVAVEQAVAEEIKTETGVDVLEAVQEAVAEAEVQAVEAPVESVVLNAEDPTTPTVQVVMPEVLPAEVVVSTEQLVETIDPASTEPQIAVYVEAAPVADPATPAAPAVETVIETPEGQTDVTVSVPTDVQAEAPAGIDLAEVVKEAVAEAEVPAEPVAEAPVQP